MTNRILPVIGAMCAALVAAGVNAAGDQRQLVALPEPMQLHLLANMRDHLSALDTIMTELSNGQLDQAADVAEQRLGMSSLAAHGAAHMAGYMPEGMRQAGTAMHRAASRFARTAQEGAALPAWQALTGITAACVRCHAAYRIR